MNMTPDNSIVVTGSGCVLPGCDTPQEFWQRLLNGDSAIASYQDEHISSDVIRCFGAVSPAQRKAAIEAVPFKLRRYSAPCAHWAVKAARDALANACLELGEIPDDRRGLFVAQGDYTFPSIPSFARGLGAAKEKKSLDMPTLTHEFMHQRGIDPFMSIKCLSNNVLAIASLTFETRGDCGAYVQDDSALTAALRSAMFSLQHGYSDVALVLCAGSYNEVLTLAELYKLEYLSSCNEGPASLRPFDQRRDGTIPGEGAIALVLETAAHAQRRQVTPLARVGGVGNLVEMHSKSHRIDAYQRCARQALAAMDLGIADIDAIVASGKGTYLHDQREAALLLALQETDSTPPITCTTPVTGNLPACPAQWLAAIGILQHGLVPPVAHLQQPLEPRLGLVREQALPRPSRHVLALEASFTGHHFAVLFSNPQA